MSGAFRQSSAHAPDSSSLEDEDGQEGGANLSPLVVPYRLLVLLAELEARERNSDS